uniref:Neurogenic locus notch homolog protein 1-like n=1 Tax=Crassostrea virginica TaxID=6565 RepID=A0A8B8B3S7_CRAVI|nr:neurogenic locus notch homolog protein 1-like [Crassostrea virginica]
MAVVQKSFFFLEFLLACVLISKVHCNVVVFVHIDQVVIHNETAAIDRCLGSSNDCGVHVNLCIRGDNTRCDETTSAWVNMTGFHTRVIGRNIGDRNNPLMMDANHTMGPSSVLRVSVYNNDSSRILLDQTLNGADQWTNGSQYILYFDQYRTFDLHNNMISVTLTSWFFCSEGYHGPNCNVYCPGDPHRCVVNGVQYCKNGWEGPNCERNVNECHAACSNSYGQCQDTIGGFRCHCGNNAFGEQCIMDNDECDDHPCNTGNCVNTLGGHNCSCPSDVTGANCENLVATTCSSLTCSGNGACSVSKGKVRCSCHFGYVGPDCSIECKLDCLNGGTCVRAPFGLPKCICQPGYQGATCEHQDLCFNHICHNMGTCVQRESTVSCYCDKGSFGDQCEYYDKCYDSPCKNNGVCIKLNKGQYHCSCPHEWTGTNCQTYNCHSASPCQNHGTCVPENTKLGYKCVCPSSAYGDLCQLHNACVSQPCQNGGSCLNNLNDYVCNCAKGYMGRNCEHRDLCYWDGKPCVNGGNCIVNTRECNCSQSWIGGQCEKNINECLYNPCGVFGTCLDVIGGYICQCTTSWTGKNCDIHMSSCAYGPCRNNGKCTDVDSTYVCTCNDQWSGRNCEVDVNECAISSPCQHGGTCVNYHGGYSCHCPTGWTGRHCENDINECLNTGSCPRLMLCNNTQGSYQCLDCSNFKCYHDTRCYVEANGPHCNCSSTAWTGRQCDQKDFCRETCSPLEISTHRCPNRCGLYSECINKEDGYACHYDPCKSSPCQNGGSCFKSHNDFNCKCDIHWAGKACDQVNYCAVNPCQHRGVCVNLPDGYRCKCEPQWIGTNCTEVNYCYPNPCQNKGACTSLTNRYSCLCASEWTGHVCEKRNYCSTNPCQNDGVCINEHSGYTCNCTENWIGSDCEQYDFCHSNPCQHRSTCLNKLHSFSCACHEGFTGVTCETAIEHCLSAPCQNNATCTNNPYGYYCRCVSGYMGPNCMQDLDECKLNMCPSHSTCYNYVGGYDCHWDKRSARDVRHRHQGTQYALLTKSTESLRKATSRVIQSIEGAVIKAACQEKSGKIIPNSLNINGYTMKISFSLECEEKLDEIDVNLPSIYKLCDNEVCKEVTENGALTTN